MFSRFTTHMKLRQNCMPKNITDGFYTFFAVVMIPVVYWFEIFIVLPKRYDGLGNTWLPAFHSALGTFILINIIGNLLALIFLDTSISSVLLQSKGDWKLCSVCETLVPPRSWHCKACNVCVLKRDHHCNFCSNCIGYFNQRYFLHFLMYIFVATLYSTVFNLSFIYEISDFNSWMAILNITFPLAMLVYDYSVKQFYMFLCLVVLIACLYSGVLLYYHMKLMLKGMVVHEKCPNIYNLGIVENLREAFGNSWKIAWISPVISSPPPGDGQSFRRAGKHD